jgi:hypothetical protein
VSKIITLKIEVKDSHSPECREYVETRRFDDMGLSEELQLTYKAMQVLGPKPVAQELPLFGGKLERAPRNRHGDPLFWESSDGRRTLISDIHPKHARNIVHGLHKQALKSNVLDLPAWCRREYPQYDGLLRKASEEVRGDG